MTVYLVPGVFGAGAQILNQNGVVAAGALVNTYAAGTTSPVVVFTDNAGTISASNPIVTGSDGRLPYELWQTEGQAIKIVLTDSLANTLGTYDNLKGINDPFAISGIPILSANNNFTGINTFSNISVGNVKAVNITANNVTANSIVVSTIATSGNSVFSGTITGNATVTGSIVVPLSAMKRTEVSNGASLVTVTAGVGTIVSINLGSVNAGDRVMMWGEVSGSKGATGGICQWGFIKLSGSSVVSFNGGAGQNTNEETVSIALAANITRFSSAILKVSSSGTLGVGIYGQSAGSNWTANGDILAIVLNNG